MKKICQKIKYTLATLSVLAGFAIVSISLPVTAAPGDSLFEGAKEEACKGTQLGNGGDCNAAAQSNLSKTIQDGIEFVSVVVGIIAVIMIIIGGLRFILANGDSGKVTTARNTIIYALVGLILVAFSQIIVRFVLTRF